jgi:hypothetical protein
MLIARKLGSMDTESALIKHFAHLAINAALTREYPGGSNYY